MRSTIIAEKYSTECKQLKGPFISVSSSAICKQLEKKTDDFLKKEVVEPAPDENYFNFKVNM